MNPFELSKSPRRWVAGILAMALALAPVSAQAEVGEAVNPVVETATQVKPFRTGEVRPTKPICPTGACTGCTCTPCGPVGCCTSCTEVQKCQGESCAASAIRRVNKPEHPLDGLSSEAIGAHDDECRAVVELQSQVIRNLCIDQALRMHQLQTMVNQLSWEVQSLQQQIQAMQQVQPTALRSR